MNSMTTPGATPGTMARSATGLLGLALALALGAGGQVAAQEPAPRAPLPPPTRVQVNYAPLILLDGERRSISACGVSIDVIRGDDRLAVASLVQRRTGEETVVEWCAQGGPSLDPSAGPAEAILDMTGVPRLSTAIETTSAAATAGAGDGEPPSAARLSAGARNCTPVTAASAPLLFQRLMVTGGTVRVAQEGQPTLSVTLQRPMPVDVSRAYLNCTGDLFRPEDAAPTP